MATDRAATRRAALLSLATGAAFFVVYLRRACPTLTLDGDSAELVTASIVWGVPHAPGYPLFTLIGHAFASLGPLGTSDATWRVHLTSAVFHGFAITATVGAALSITRSRIAAVAAGCALGLSRSFFLGSLYAEVFPLNDLFVALLFFLALALRLRGRDPGAARFITFAGCAGLAAAHHMMLALVIPSLAILTFHPLADYLRRDRRRALALALAAIAPFLASYALIPLAAARNPVLSWGDVHDLGSLVSLVTRHDYGGLFSSVHGSGHGSGPARLGALGGLLLGSFGIATLAAALYGAVDLWRRQRTIGIALVLAVLLAGPVFAWMNALDTSTEEGLAFFERFTTMCAVPIALSFGAGIAAAVRALPSSRVVRIAGAVLLAAWGVESLARVRAVDMSHDERGIAFAHDLVLSTPDGSLLLLSGDAAGSAALYVCEVEHLCGARTALSPGGLFLPWAMAQFRRRHPEIPIPWSSGPALKRTHELAAAQPEARPLFAYPDLLEKDPALMQTFAVFPDHLLFRLWPHGTDPALAGAAFIASARDLDDPHGACRGCTLPPPLDHPTQEMQLVHAYEAARANHANFAAQAVH